MKFWALRWSIDGSPETEEQVGRNKAEANTAAGRKEAELEAWLADQERARTPAVGWGLVLHRYEAEELSRQKPRSGDKWHTAMNHIEAFGEPDTLDAFDDDYASRFAAWLYARQIQPDTIAGYQAELKRTLRWAARIWRGYVPPHFTMPRRRSGKRAPTKEEFERMLARLPEVVGEADAPSWRFFLWGAWLCGRRLGVLLRLRWHTGELAIADLDTPTGALVIAHGADKSGRADSIPLRLMPGFRRLLRRVPPEARHGLVFRPLTNGKPSRPDRVSKVATAIGKLAGVVVDRRMIWKDGREVERVQFAGCHALRRACITRWAMKYPPPVLKRLAGHGSIATTMKYYVDVDLDTLYRRRKIPKV